MPYNPFGKKIGDPLDISDLQKLITDQVAEGYYVEYKSAFQKPDKIARSLASFANTYGGWYFVGVEEENTIAKNICGLAKKDLTDPVAKIMDPARQIISHMPFLLPQIIDVSSTHIVIAVYIAESDDAPHIHKDGRIYRRKADASAPESETNRYVIDQMVERGRQERESFTRFSQDDRVFSQGEGNPWINVYLRPRPNGFVAPKDLLVELGVQALLDKSKQRVPVLLTDSLDAVPLFEGNIPFDSAYPAGSSIILQQQISDQIGLNRVRLQLFLDGSARIRVPIPTTSIQYHSMSDSYMFQPPFRSSKVIDFLRGQDMEKLLGLRLGNLVVAISTVIILVNFYIEWLEQEGWKDQLWSRVSIDNVWRLVPVIDSDAWVRHVKKFGLPVIMEESHELPSLDESPDSLNYEQRKMIWQRLLVDISLCLGILPLEGVLAWNDALKQQHMGQ